VRFESGVCWPSRFLRRLQAAHSFSPIETSDRPE
jgi:hypothetical protein